MKLAIIAFMLLSSSAKASESKPSKAPATKRAEKPAKDKAPETEVTYLDLSGPAETESEFPQIASKGKL